MTDSEIRKLFFKFTDDEINGVRYLTQGAFKKAVAILIEEQLSTSHISKNTYPDEFVHLAKGNYLDKDGSIKKAQLMVDHLGNEYFMVAKDKLYSR